VVEPGYTVGALDESTWNAFAALVQRNNGIFGGCWCMGFHADDSREPATNRRRNRARVRAGTDHAALVFDGDGCVSRFARAILGTAIATLVVSAGYIVAAAALRPWAMSLLIVFVTGGCFWALVAPWMRRAGRRIRSRTRA